MKLHRVNRPKGHNRFCGPAAISAVTGMTTGDAAALIRKVTGRDRVMGTWEGDIRKALSHCGISMTPRHSAPKATLAAWLKASVEDRTAGRVFLVSAGHHWQLISGRRYVCGLVTDIISIRDKRVKRRARVRAVWELTTNGITLPAPTKKVINPQIRIDAKLRRECKSLAAMIGAEVDQAPGDWRINIWPPEYVDEDTDPFQYDHGHDTWAQALDAVKTYADMPRT